MNTGNLLHNLPGDMTAEVSRHLAGHGDKVRIEQIISRGHHSPETGWYEQDESEWVVLLQGQAILTFEDGQSMHLRPGDWVDIAPRQRHRVDWTDPDIETVWLAVHY